LLNLAQLKPSHQCLAGHLLQVGTSQKRQSQGHYNQADHSQAVSGDLYKAFTHIEGKGQYGPL
jgi:hypothetical protein